MSETITYFAKGHEIIVDAADAAIFAHAWIVTRKHNVFYAVRNSYKGGGRANPKYRRVYLHRELLASPAGQVDHINGNGLDNRRSNLRVTTHSGNGQNRGRQSNNKSGFKGVYWHKQREKWAAQIVFEGKKISLGLYATAAEAGVAYARKQVELCGGAHPRALP